MVTDFQKFLAKSEDIAERKSASDRTGAELGYYYCTPLEAGILLDPSTPAHIAQARTQIRYTNTPQGIAAWERGAQETQRKLELMLAEKPSKAAEPEVQSPFPKTQLEIS